MILLLPILAGLAAGTPLLTPSSHPSPLAVHLAPCKEQGVVTCQEVEVHLEVLGHVEVEVPGGEVLVLEDAWEEGSLTLYTYTGARGGQAFFSTRESKVLGSVTVVRVDRVMVYQLEPCSSTSSCHVWKEQGEEFGEEEQVQVGERGIHLAEHVIEELEERGRRNREDITTFSITFYTTVEFAEQTADIPLFVDTAIADMNKGYEDSDIPVRVELHCIRASTISESPAMSSSDMLHMFSDYMGSYDEIRASADAAQLLATHFSSSTCGSGYTYTASSGSGHTLTVVKKSCSYGYHSSGHEVGHNYGCQHNQENGHNSHYDYGYGWFIGPPGFGYRTCMAYSADGYKTRLNRFSNPTLFYQDEVTGDFGEADNARVIRENRFLMAAIGDESRQC